MKEKTNKGLVIIIIIETVIILLISYLLITKVTLNNTVKDSNNEVVDINENENLKLYFYVSSTTNNYRYSLTLRESAEVDGVLTGFFDLGVLNEFEGPTASGYYKIEDNKLTFTWINSTDSVNNDVFNLINASITPDTSQDNYYTYSTNYSNSSLTIGNITFEKVN
jgi:hypothetical protein